MQIQQKNSIRYLSLKKKQFLFFFTATNFLLVKDQLPSFAAITARSLVCCYQLGHLLKLVTALFAKHAKCKKSSA